MTFLMDYDDDFTFENKYTQLTKGIDYAYSYSIQPNNFEFIPKEYFSGSSEKIDDVLNYCFHKKYINKHDPKFQKFAADCICNMNTENQFDIIIYKEGIQNMENLRVFYYICKYILTPDTIKNYINDKNETLFHQIFCKMFINDAKIINEFFIIFDEAKIEYSYSVMKSILIKNLDKRNFHMIVAILNKSKIDLNDNDIFEILANLILIRITTFKYKINTSENPIYKLTYNQDTILKIIFSEEMLDIKNTNLTDPNSIINKKVITALTLQFGDLNYKFYENSINRAKLVRPLKILENYYSLFKLCIDNGLDLSKKINGFTLYDIYMNGCYPIQLLQPEMHNIFINLFKGK